MRDLLLLLLLLFLSPPPPLLLLARVTVAGCGGSHVVRCHCLCTIAVSCNISRQCSVDITVDCAVYKLSTFVDTYRWVNTNRCCAAAACSDCVFVCPLAALAWSGTKNRALVNRGLEKVRQILTIFIAKPISQLVILVVTKGLPYVL